MYVVALAALATPLEAEASALAADLGQTVYEARLLLSAALPTVILSTRDRDHALGQLGKLRARGHEAFACDTAAVVASASMIAMRDFTLGEVGIALDKPAGVELPYEDVLAIFRAARRRQVDSVTETTEKNFSPGRAIATGGLMMNKKVTSRTSATMEEREQVLYLFRKSGQTPWLLRETNARYRNADRAPTTLENFVRTIAKLRERAPGAAYDERLMTTRKVAEHTVRSSVGGVDSTTTTADGGVDLAAHLLAMMFARRAPQLDG